MELEPRQISIANMYTVQFSAWLDKQNKKAEKHGCVYKTDQRSRMVPAIHLREYPRTASLQPTQVSSAHCILEKMLKLGFPRSIGRVTHLSDGMRTLSPIIALYKTAVEKNLGSEQSSLVRREIALIGRTIDLPLKDIEFAELSKFLKKPVSIRSNTVIAVDTWETFPENNVQLTYVSAYVNFTCHPTNVYTLIRLIVTGDDEYPLVVLPEWIRAERIVSLDSKSMQFEVSLMDIGAEQLRTNGKMCTEMLKSMLGYAPMWTLPMHEFECQANLLFWQRRDLIPDIVKRICGLKSYADRYRSGYPIRNHPDMWMYWTWIISDDATGIDCLGAHLSPDKSQLYYGEYFLSQNLDLETSEISPLYATVLAIHGAYTLDDHMVDDSGLSVIGLNVFGEKYGVYRSSLGYAPPFDNSKRAAPTPAVNTQKQQFGTSLDAVFKSVSACPTAAMVCEGKPGPVVDITVADERMSVENTENDICPPSFNSAAEEYNSSLKFVDDLTKI